MAEIAESGGGGGHKGGGKKRAKKNSTRVDMTPMVDLAFLLLTFFVLTSTFSKSKVMSLVYPAKVPTTEKPSEVFNAVTFLVTEDKLYYYFGQFYGPTSPNPEGKPLTTLEETDFGPNGVRKILAEKNAYVTEQKKVLDVELQKGQIADTTYKRMLSEAKTSKKALKVLIKTDEKATCKNFVDLVDELKIANIGVIAPVDLTKDEEALMKAKED